MTTQHNKAKRWQFELRALFFAAGVVAFGSWAWGSPSETAFGLRIAVGVFAGIPIFHWLFHAKRPTPKRFRLRFSIRTLVIAVTLVCCYAACWGPTKRGTEDVNLAANRTAIAVASEAGHRFLGNGPSVAVAPLIVRSSQFTWERVARRPYCESRHYYFWFFGYVVELPFSRAVG